MTLQGHCPGKGAERAERVEEASSSSSAIIEERETAFFFKKEGNKMGAVLWKEREAGLKQENLKRMGGCITMRVRSG